MEREVDLTVLGPDASLLLVGAVLDFTIGDPVYRWHPVRVMGTSITTMERWLRSAGANGRWGGCALVGILAIAWVAGLSALFGTISGWHPVAGAVVHILAIYGLLALGDLLKHGDAVDGAGRSLETVRHATAKLVGRDTDRMDRAACRRAAIESLAENLVDGFTAPVFWYAAAGLPGIVLFKLVSTMDSMVGYKNVRYRHFGWCSARSDDVLNYVPARLTWLLIALAAGGFPGASGMHALRTGWRQHAVVPGPNPGWSEAAMAGAIQRRLVGPVWLDGNLVTDSWLGDPADTPAAESSDYRRARRITIAAAVLATAAASGLIR